MERLDVTKISSVKSRPHIDWQALESIRGDSEDVDKLLAWLSESAESGRMLPYESDEN